jgi:two-component system phosphate regulon response regulator OmpR
MEIKSSAHILVVDDDLRLRSLVEAHLRQVGFTVDGVRDGQGLDHKLHGGEVDLIILDLGLPDEDGLQICQRLRLTYDTPILILTARGEEEDRLPGLEMGADDYLSKPFHPRELIARVQAILRRTKPMNRGRQHADEPEICMKGAFVVDTRRQKILWRGEPLELSQADFQTLSTLIKHEGQPLSRERLMLLSRGRTYASDDRSIDMQISRLRKLLDSKTDGAQHIRTVWGSGYMFLSEP